MNNSTECQDLSNSVIPTTISSRLIYDKCYMDLQNQQSSGPCNYRLKNNRSCECEIKSLRKKVLDAPGHSARPLRDGYGWTSYKGCNIDNDSKVRNSKNLTNLRVINQLS